MLWCLIFSLTGRRDASLIHWMIKFEIIDTNGASWFPNNSESSRLQTKLPCNVFNYVSWFVVLFSSICFIICLSSWMKHYMKLFQKSFFKVCLIRYKNRAFDAKDIKLHPYKKVDRGFYSSLLSCEQHFSFWLINKYISRPNIHCFITFGGLSKSDQISEKEVNVCSITPQLFSTLLTPWTKDFCRYQMT